MPRSTSKPRPNPPPEPPPTIEGAWLLKAIGAVIAGALVSTYLTFCFLFSRGQWQLVLHPTRTNASQSQEILHFAPGPSAQPQLAGQWLPAGPDARYRNLTILFLPSGDGDRTTSVATQTALHNLGLNLFVFDYRGYGQSVNMHPSQERMLEDSESAWSYLTGFRNVSGATIIPYGIGVGTSLATHLALAHTEIPAVILDSPYADLSSVLWKDSSLRLLPTSLLFHETFPLADPLSQLQRPKLLIAAEKDPNPASFSRAADPKISVTLPTDSGPLFDRSVTRFLDQYLAQYLTQSLAVPSPAPSATKPN